MEHLHCGVRNRGRERVIESGFAAFHVSQAESARLAAAALHTETYGLRGEMDMSDRDIDIELSEFVIRLAALLAREDVTMPFENEAPWHLLFYDLKRLDKPGRPTFLDDLIFDWDGPYPKSQDLSRFLHTLHWTVASVDNPTYRVLRLPPRTAELWYSRYENSRPELKAFLDMAHSRARERFSQPAPVAIPPE